MRGLLLISALILGACTAGNTVADRLARDRAKTVVNSVVANRFPGVNAAPVTDCIIDAATAGEIISIAGATVSGVTPSTVEKVLEIARRPAAVQCIAESSLSSFGRASLQRAS
ncbi:succinate dehydrogenase [Maritimibacter sp. 55A14]|uniref:succinate dehydrogenase n=1 Tax=Maritimibacter sp. 55A14 TaxID=2174844 RepID=UPI000D622348|nr:succinate dehydrogenase [Maritimibacter sp. 55A14]PWE34136.1 succinate dehydrogenase [Maritimibacter sp. 55A14]